MTTIRALILPKPITPEWDWQIHALCRQMDTELFYSPDGEERAAGARRERAAKEICLGCPVRRACADHAVTATGHSDALGVRTFGLTCAWTVAPVGGRRPVPDRRP
ncbi:WhiB family transcriptional regulator [Rhodococcus sp. NPDC057529]|uniref:WhiB family transcriptional regulator n=1 Tax=Rhodococcus sp. NPDC057529 TaxID=3346158 RepID=UPI00366C122D